MMAALRILFGFAIYALVAYAMGRRLRFVSRQYPCLHADEPETVRRTVRRTVSAAALPATLPQRIPGILAHAMKT